MHETEKNYFYIETLLSIMKTNNKILPITALIVNNNEIISSAQNTNQLGHAEVLTIKKALLKNKITKNSILYCSLEPCLMCVGTALNAGITLIYYASRSKDSGIHTVHNLTLIPNITIIPLLKYEKIFENTLQNFFKQKR